MEITTVGRLEMCLGDRTIVIASRKARAMLGYLLVNESPKETREHLVGLLWSESDSEKARGSLRHCLKGIRLALRGMKFDGLQLDEQVISFDPASVTVDLWDIIKLAKEGAVHPKLLEIPHLTDEILKDVELVDPVFRTWLLTKRQALNQRLIVDLERALDDAVIGLREGEDIARAVQNLDATNEVACRYLMRTRAAQDDIGGALKIYTDFWELLDREYDVEPTEQTQALFGELKAALPFAGPPEANAGASVQAGSATSNRQDGAKLLLSIGNFDASNVPADRRYLVQGFRSELIGHLTRFREWMVRERPANAMSVGNTDEYILQADTLPHKKGVRLALSLRESATDAYLWGDGVNLKTVDWGEAQVSVMRRIAAALNIHVSARRLVQVGPKSSDDLIAYDMWLRGQSEFIPFEPEGCEKAIQLYRTLIAQHSEFAPAYSSLAQLQNSVHFIHPGKYRSKSATAEALHFATEAVRLDPMDSRSQLCLGWANAMAGRDDQAAVHHSLAVDLNESDFWTCCSAALGSAFRGELVTARELSTRAERLALVPTTLYWRYQAMIRYLTGDFTGSLAAAANAESSIPNVLVWKAISLVRTGRREEAQMCVTAFFEAIEKRWTNADLPATPENMTSWFLHAFPIKHLDNWSRLRDDFGHAGAPVADTDFNQWPNSD